MAKPLWRRVVSAGRRAAVKLPGVGVVCPVCDFRAMTFQPHGVNPARQRPNARCQSCGSLERHRLIWGVLTAHGLPLAGGSLLHFAPEPCLKPRLRQRVRRYVSFDLAPKDVDVRGDITELPFRDGAFDVILCSHVLEHIPDDAAAMRELRRVLSPTGWAVIDAPMNLDAPDTLEDPDADEATRIRDYGQADHVRMYGADYRDRLRAAGFEVVPLVADEVFGARAARRRAVPPKSAVHLCRPATPVGV